MKNSIAVFVFLMGICAAARADVWRWVDADGQSHLVDTNTPIYTWVDELGGVHYSDTPEHKDSVSVELVWVSKGSVNDIEGATDEPGSGYEVADETPEERSEREEAEAYYCKRATEIYESYVNAPRLYKTNDAGEREYLSKEEAARTIAETRTQMNDFCH